MGSGSPPDVRLTWEKETPSEEAGAGNHHGHTPSSHLEEWGHFHLLCALLLQNIGSDLYSSSSGG